MGSDPGWTKENSSVVRHQRRQARWDPDLSRFEEAHGIQRLLGIWNLFLQAGNSALGIDLHELVFSMCNQTQSAAARLGPSPKGGLGGGVGMGCPSYDIIS